MQFDQVCPIRTEHARFLLNKLSILNLAIISSLSESFFSKCHNFVRFILCLFFSLCHISIPMRFHFVFNSVHIDSYGSMHCARNQTTNRCKVLMFLHVIRNVIYETDCSQVLVSTMSGYFFFIHLPFVIASL